NINSSKIAANLNSVSLNSANNTNLTTSSNFYEQSQSSFDFESNIRLGLSYNFKETWKSIEALKDVKLENAVKYFAISSASGYAGAGAASPQIATYAPLINSMANGDSFDESLAQNQDYIRDANTISNAGKGASGSAGLTVELSYSQSKSGFKQTEIVANNITSKSDINLTSNNSNLNISSSNLNAASNINLNARQGDINIKADAATSSSFSKDLALSVSIPLIGQGGAASVSFAQSKSTAQTYLNSNLEAGDSFNLNSGANTNIQSSNILASSINMKIAGDFNLESKQNTSASKSMSFALDGGAGNSGNTNSASGNVSYSQSKANRNWVDNQTSIIGTNSVKIDVANNTNIVGAVIANITNANEIGLDSTLLGSDSTRGAKIGSLLTNAI
ncbi:MAG: hypothetical protein EBZ77_16865, partial [Chitinophagia bacterium]|nr:hypothetical protein [Chitinophagia bacterium]